MATKHQVIDLHQKHPQWNSVQIAKALNCDSAYVRATFQRNGLALHREKTQRERIIEAERDRCAKAATAMIMRLLPDDLADSINGYVAAAIRGEA